MDDTTDPPWSALTRGFRIILARAMGTRLFNGYASAQQLADDLQAYQQNYDLMAQQQANALIDKAEGMYEQAQSKTPGEQSQAADAALTLLDLAARGRQRRQRHPNPPN